MIYWFTHSLFCIKLELGTFIHCDSLKNGYKYQEQLATKNLNITALHHAELTWIWVWVRKKTHRKCLSKYDILQRVTESSERVIFITDVGSVCKGFLGKTWKKKKKESIIFLVKCALWSMEAICPARSCLFPGPYTWREVLGSVKGTDCTSQPKNAHVQTQTCPIWQGWREMEPARSGSPGDHCAQVSPRQGAGCQRVAIDMWRSYSYWSGGSLLAQALGKGHQLCSHVTNGSTEAKRLIFRSD